MEYQDRRINGAGWLLLGSLTGAAAALLFAPASGQATRRKLARGVRNGADNVRELSDRIAREARAVGAAARGAMNGDGEAEWSGAEEEFKNDGLGRGLEREVKRSQRG